MPDPSDPRGFLILHGNRLEDLRALVIEHVRRNPLPPLVPEVFLVQSNGMRHWLQQGLADDLAGLGICAATEIELPSSFLWRAYRTVLGADTVPAQLAFDKDALTWRLMRLLPACAASDPAGYAPLLRYLADDPDGRRTWQLAQQVADVLDGYQQYRADWLAAWERGDDHAVPPAQRWQPALWRALREDLGPGLADSSRAAVHTDFVDAMAAFAGPADRPPGLPPRIIVFGISALPLQSVRALAELGRVCEVLFVVQNPCREYWRDVTESRDAGPPPAHALLAAWGKQGRDYLHSLDEFDQTDSRPHQLGRTEVFSDPAEQDDGRAPTRLARLQSSFVTLAASPPVPDAVHDDDSLQFVSAHSPLREVEILHDQILAWLDDDASLTPRDIIVMVPDMVQFAAPVQAVFGRFGRGHRRHVPYSVADATPRLLPLVQGLEQLLSLPERRITLADWLAQFELGAVRRRFGLTEADVAELRDALEAAQVRWGLDAAHRETQGLAPGLAQAEQNSWLEGLRRLLLGYATADSTCWEGVLAVPQFSGLGARRLGALADWIEAMRCTLDALAQSLRPAEWQTVLQDLLERCFRASDDDDERLLHRLRQSLADWVALCVTAGFDEPVKLPVLREHWLSQLEAPSLRQRFFGGGVQFATLLPMRAIPFRVVCLLGMNDGDYPRRATPRDFDLLQRDFRAGDRSRREDDRYLFLEALLSARQRFYVSHVGRRATDDVEQMPSVLVGQLRDELAQRFTPLPDAVQHPLQPFSPRYFTAGSRLFTYDDDWQARQRGMLPARVTPGSPAPLPAVIPLPLLQRLLKQPVEVFWRDRLDVYFDTPEEAVEEDEPFSLDGLEQFEFGQDLLDALARGGSAALEAQLELSGRLPLGAPRQRWRDLLRDKVLAVESHARPLRDTWQRRTLPLMLALDHAGRRIEGRVDGLYEGPEGLYRLVLRPGSCFHSVCYQSVLRIDVLLRDWVVHVVAAAAGQRLTTVVATADGLLHCRPLDAGTARGILDDWLPALASAWTAPLPCPARSACVYLAALQLQTDETRALAEAMGTYLGGYQREGELARSAYLTRSLRDEAVVRTGLATWAQRLYGALHASVRSGPPYDGVAP